MPRSGDRRGGSGCAPRRSSPARPACSPRRPPTAAARQPDAARAAAGAGHADPALPHGGRRRRGRGDRARSQGRHRPRPGACRLQGGDRRQAARDRLGRSRRVRAAVDRRLDGRRRPRDHDERAQGERPHRPAGHRPGQPRQRRPRGDRIGAAVGALDARQGPDRPADVSRAGAERRLHGRPRQGRRGADASGRRRPAVAALPAIQHQHLGGDPDGRAGHVRPRRRHRPRMPGQPAALSDRSRDAGQDDAARRAVADPARAALAAGHDAAAWPRCPGRSMPCCSRPAGR